MKDCEVLAALADVVINYLSGFSVHELSSVMTGFFRVWFVDEAVLDAIAGEALGRGAELHAEDLSNLLWSVLAGARRCSFAGVRQSGTLRGSGGRDSSERDWFARLRVQHLQEVESPGNGTFTS